MKITSLGHSAFLIITDDGIRIVTDPYASFVGYPMPKVKADVVTCSHQHPDHNNLKAVEGDPFVIKDAKTYTTPYMTVTSIVCSHDDRKGALRGTNNIYKIRVNGMTLVHMGDIGEKFNIDLIQRLGDVDVLFIPVGGVFTIGPEEARNYVDAIEPRIAVPMHYKLRRSYMDLLPIEKVLPYFSDMDTFHTFELDPAEQAKEGQTRFCILDNRYSF